MNLDKLDAAIAHIEADSERHDQAYYADCGTTLCLAGVIAMQDGWEPAWDLGHLEADGVFATRTFERDGRIAYASTVAQEILGADDAQAESLFLEAADLADIKYLRDVYADDAALGEAGERSDSTKDLGGSS